MDSNVRTDRFLHSFSLNPSITFETQHTDEKPVLMLRAHPITQLPWIFNALFLFLVLIILNLIPLGFITINQRIIVNVFGIVFILSYLWYNFLHWFYNVGIVTNERIVDVDFSNILYKEVNIAMLDKIEDITSKSSGYIGSLFNFGDVFVQTAGSELNIEFHKTPAPSEVVDIINKLIRR